VVIDTIKANKIRVFIITSHTIFDAIIIKKH
jgi:hypothetical protein